MLTFIFMCNMEKCKLGTASLIPRFMAFAIYKYKKTTATSKLELLFFYIYAFLSFRRFFLQQVLFCNLR